MRPALVFCDTRRRLDYGARLSRLRWRRVAGAATATEWSPETPAERVFTGAEAFLGVLDEAAVPVFDGLLEAVPGAIVAASDAVPIEPLHTLRELEGTPLTDTGGARRMPAALLFRAADFPARPDETLKLYIQRLQNGPVSTDPSFRVIRFDQTSDRERPELTRRLPPGRLRILDAGCGAGGTIAGGKATHPEWTVTGIEADPDLAGRARAHCDRVLEGDLRAIVPRLARAGERFDAVVFADVLEHLEDPIAALEAARGLAAVSARLLVSVPNVGHLSVVRDLVSGRFDPVPAGLTDARHLRWFTRTLLAEAIEEAGWRLDAIEREPGAPAPEATVFLERTAGWPERDLGSLGTYQWVALASA